MRQTATPNANASPPASTSLQRGHFALIVRDDALALAMSEPVQRYSVGRRFRSMREALPRCTSDGTRWSGALVDADSCDGCVRAALAEFRAKNPLLPVLVIASRVDATLVNGLHGLRAELIVKPVWEANIVSFVQRSLVSGFLPDERVAAWVDELAREKQLSSREVQLLAYALGSDSRELVLRRLGITENTLQSQVKTLLKKCSARSMDDLAKSVLRDALVFDGRGDALEDENGIDDSDLEGAWA
jgi:DNA-binding NarL/FixJ family response regulator